MKKAYKGLFALILALILTASLAACGDTQSDYIAGTYSTGDTTYVFAEDGSMSVTYDNETKYGAYNADGGSLTIVYEDGTETYSYTVDSDELVLSGWLPLLGTVYSKDGDAVKTIDGWSMLLSTGQSVTDPMQALKSAGISVSDNDDETESSTDSVPGEDESDSTKATDPSDTSDATDNTKETGSSDASKPTSESSDNKDNQSGQDSSNTPTGKNDGSQSGDGSSQGGNSSSQSGDGSSQGGNNTKKDGSSTPADTGESSNPYLEGHVTVGSTVYYGSYEQDNDLSNGSEKIEWTVLKVDGNKILLLSKYALDVQAYDNTGANVTWYTCSLRTWLNDSFLNSAFTAEEQGYIPTTYVTADENGFYTKIYAGEATEDKVFLLSAVQAYNYMPNYKDRACTATAYAIANGAYYDPEYGGYWWWLRTPGNRSGHAALIEPDGVLDYVGYYVNNLEQVVRPAIWVNFR